MNRYGWRSLETIHLPKRMRFVFAGSRELVRFRRKVGLVITFIRSNSNAFRSRLLSDATILGAVLRCNKLPADTDPEMWQDQGST